MSITLVIVVCLTLSYIQLLQELYNQIEQVSTELHITASGNETKHIPKSMKIRLNSNQFIN